MYIVSKCLKLFFLTKHNALELMQIVLCISNPLLLLLSNFHCMDELCFFQSIHIYPLKDIWGFPVCGIANKAAINIIKRPSYD